MKKHSLFQILLLIFALVTTGWVTPSWGEDLHVEDGAITPEYSILLQKINDFRQANGLLPLNFDNRLQNAAAFHAMDMVDQLYYDHVDPHGFYPQDRTRNAGYDPMFWGESMGALAFNNWIAPDEAAEAILDLIVDDALQGGKEGAPLLDPLLKDIGIYAIGAQIYLFESWQNVYVLVLDFGSEKEIAQQDDQNIFTVYGHVYKDQNNNGRYDSREGVDGLTLEITGPIGVFGPKDPVKFSYTLRDGEFQFTIGPGTYNVILHGEDGPLYSTTLPTEGVEGPIELSIPIF